MITIWGLKDAIHVKCLLYYLVHSKCSINTGYYYVIIAVIIDWEGEKKIRPPPNQWLSQ